MIPRRNQIVASLEHHVPPAAVGYALSLWDAHPFVLRLSKERQTKLGDYRWEPRQRWHIISVNRNLPPPSFLLTYIHEVAHLVTFQQHRGRVQPHGPEWKDNFSQLMQPVLKADIYPEPILTVLSRHMRNPAASSYSDPALVRVLYPEEKAPEGQVPLHALQPGQAFAFRHKNYRLLKHRRTRSLVEQTDTLKRYLIAQQALVTPAEGEGESSTDALPATTKVGTLQPGQHFRFRGQVYKVLRHRQTKTLVAHTNTEKEYLIPMQAEVLFILPPDHYR